MARKFHVSNLGNDSWDGLTEMTPFKTLERLQGITLQPGDEILLHRGHTFLGSLLLTGSGTETRPVRVRAYGNGALPVMTGAALLFEGQAPDEAVWQVPAAFAVKQLLVNGQPYELARIPAHGFYSIQRGDKLSLEDPFHLAVYGDLAGATARIRVVNWQYETARVKACAAGRIEFEAPMMYACPPRYGYLLDNKAAFLREPGQWFWDEKQQQLLVMLRKEHRQIPLRLEAVLHDTAIRVPEQSAYWEIRNLEICHYGHTGVHGGEGSHHVAIEDCHMHDLQVFGVFCNLNTRHYTIHHNRLHDIWGRGICTLESSHNRITGNELRNIGLKPGYGFDGVNNGVGIAVLKTEVTYRLSKKVFEQALLDGAPAEAMRLLESMVDLPYPDEKFLVEELEHRVETSDRAALLAILLPGIREELEANRMQSTNNYVAWNRVAYTGYAGIRVDGTHSLVEYNTIDHTLLHMNDGGALYCWAQNEDYTHHNIFRRNIITNVIGNCEATPNDFSYAFGIYTDNKCHHMEISENVVVGAVGGILVNDEAHHQTIRNNILYDNLYGLHFSEYFMPGTLRDCVVEGNILFAKHRHQRALFIESRIGSNFRPATFKRNVYANPYYPFPIQLMEYENGIRVIRELDKKAWMNWCSHDAESTFISTANHDAGGQYTDILINVSSGFKRVEIPAQHAFVDIVGNPLGKEVELSPFGAAIIIQQ